MPGGSGILRSTRTTRVPAHSVPWMQPTTSTRSVPPGSPRWWATIGRPCAEWPAISTAAIASGANMPGIRSGAGGASVRHDPQRR